MSLFRLPCGKLPLSFLAVPAGKDGRVECPCQTVNDFIRVMGSVCGLFLFVQTHAPLTVPPWQSRARKSKFHFYQAQGCGCFPPCTCSRWLVDGLQVPVVMRLLHRSAVLQTVPYRGRLNIRFGHCTSCLFDNSSVKLCKHDTPLLFAPSGANHEQGLGQARPNKITSEMQAHCRSEVPVEHNIFKN